MVAVLLPKMAADGGDVEKTYGNTATNYRPLGTPGSMQRLQSPYNTTCTSGSPMPIVPLESTIISPLWTPGIKLCVERIQGVKASLVLPASLTENRKKICRTASRHATSRLHEELTESLLQQLLLRFDELAAKHKVYFHEYMGQSPLLYDLVVNSELAWVSTLDETVLKRIGNGDRELGIEEIVGAICQIADDELNPTIRKYGRMGPSLSKERI